MKDNARGPYRDGLLPERFIVSGDGYAWAVWPDDGSLHAPVGKATNVCPEPWVEYVRTATVPAPWLTAEAAIDLLLAEHTPTVNETVSVIEDGEERPPTVEELVADYDELWCNGCHRAADRCTVMPVLALVRSPEEIA